MLITRPEAYAIVLLIFWQLATQTEELDDGRGLNGAIQNADTLNRFNKRCVSIVGHEIALHSSLSLTSLWHKVAAILAKYYTDPAQTWQQQSTELNAAMRQGLCAAWSACCACGLPRSGSNERAERIVVWLRDLKKEGMREGGGRGNYINRLQRAAHCVCQILTSSSRIDSTRSPLKSICLWLA